MNGMRFSIVRRCGMLLLLSALPTLAGALRGGQSAEAATTTAISGLQVVSSPSEDGSQSPKTAVAYCPSAKRVIGGGGEIYADGGIPTNPALTELRPVRLYDGSRDAYVVTGAETPPGITSSWRVWAYAVCADPLPGLRIISTSTTTSSPSVQDTAAGCSGGWVLGTGGRISTTEGNVVLQVARPSHPGDIARIQAHEVAVGYTGSWSVTAYAVCVPNKPAGYRIVFGESVQRSSESVKAANASCPGGRRLLSAGAAIAKTAPGNVSLQTIRPSGSDHFTQARAVENTPTSANWDFIVATAICAS